MKKFQVCVICGGPSKERGISLNSARSVMDHLVSETTEIVPIYVDQLKNFYAISPSQLYSNTPSDFDFKLNQNARRLDETALADVLRDVDLVFPAIHGAFGEDGELQELLQDYDIPFVGPSAEACRKMFNKHRANFHLSELGFFTLPFAMLKKGDDANAQTIQNFFETHNLNRAVVKPSAGGSSIGVFSVGTPEHALQKAEHIFEEEIDDIAVLEPFCDGREFTVIVLQNPQTGAPVAMVPSEIDMNYQNHQIFDFRRKYLPTNMVTYHCPPRFEAETIAEIRTQAEDIFKKLNLRDMVRVDGWLMPDGKLWFSDLNPVSGMEQNSFMFQQPARLGLSHQQVLHTIVQSACKRHNLALPQPSASATAHAQTVHVLFGGATAERQVSLMSGTNVWFKLRQAQGVDPKPFFLDLNGQVWPLPYGLSLDHTVEEILNNCQAADDIAAALNTYAQDVQERLGITPESTSLATTPMTLDAFMDLSAAENAFVFLALHGGIGEDGTLQEKLAAKNIPFNGSDAAGSRLCMDKFKTGEAIRSLNDDKIQTVPKRVCAQTDFAGFSEADFESYWNEVTTALKSMSLIIKPRSDGCSAGVIKLSKWQHLQRYVTLVAQGVRFIEPDTFPNQADIIEMPSLEDGDYLLESFVETDRILIQGKTLEHQKNTGWIEFTVGVLEQEGTYYAMNPSLTVAEGDMLSLEEKFQGGTGVNITPPPENIVAPQMLEQTKCALEKAAKALGIKNYARIDVFLNVRSGRIYIIEANSLPGLTPATVIYHQALAEETPLFPKDFLKKLVDLKLGKQKLSESSQIFAA